MNTQTVAIPQDTSRQCHVCGHDVKRELRHVSDKPGTYRCSSLYACVDRTNARDAHMDLMYAASVAAQAVAA